MNVEGFAVAAGAERDEDGFTPEQRAHYDRVWAEIWAEKTSCKRCGRNESEVSLEATLLARVCAGADARECKRLEMKARLVVIQGGLA